MIYRAKRSTGFSLLKLMIVIVIMGIVAIVIIGILAAVAIPRMSRGSAGAADAALRGDLLVLRSAIDMYAGEHTGQYPAAATIEDQLTQYTDISGATSATKTATHIYGPYLRKSPPLPVGAKKGNTTIAANSGGSVGWKYTAATGAIQANTTGSEADSSGKLYRDY
ncbi:MAG: type II secretion system protein [Phycisphaerae bacterium]|jgi:type II secretory pathway pseudopilin PulG|nr:type II secretion system protein [Phycisphaerae bacterium]